MKTDLINKISEASQFISGKAGFASPQVGLILGSGLGALADEITDPIVIAYADIPYFPQSTVAGHAGQLVIGKLEGKQVIAMQGRFHYYEGYSLEQVTFPVRVMKALDVSILIVTNACGGLNPKLSPGTLMFIRDHINFLGSNPLMGSNHDELGPRFPDMSSAYDVDYIQLGESIAKKENIDTYTGVYTAVTGPYYCSKAELSMVRGFGSDTIGMSTVPEVIVAVHTGMKVLGIACVTDMAIPETLEPPTHAHVVEVANKTRPKFIRLVKAILKEMVVA